MAAKRRVNARSTERKPRSGPNGKREPVGSAPRASSAYFRDDESRNVVTTVAMGRPISLRTPPIRGRADRAPAVPARMLPDEEGAERAGKTSRSFEPSAFFSRRSSCGDRCVGQGSDRRLGGLEESGAHARLHKNHEDRAAHACRRRRATSPPRRSDSADRETTFAGHGRKSPSSGAKRAVVRQTGSASAVEAAAATGPGAESGNRLDGAAASGGRDEEAGTMPARPVGFGRGSHGRGKVRILYERVSGKMLAYEGEPSSV